jgi:hypothetical protein
MDISEHDRQRIRPPIRAGVNLTSRFGRPGAVAPPPEPPPPEKPHHSERGWLMWRRPRTRLIAKPSSTRVSSNHRRASSGSPVVNMWKRFAMPAYRRKGPQRPIAVACVPLVGRRRSESPDAARWGRRRRGT